MPDETNTPTQKPGGWSAARKHLATWDNSALLALIKDLYDTAAENRDFILARAQVEDDSSDVLDTYRRRVVEQFFPRRGDAKLKLGEARKIDFKNQNIGTLVSEIRTAFFSSAHTRIKFTKQQREALYQRDSKTCKPCEGVASEARQHRPHPAARRWGLHRAGKSADSL